MTRFEWKSIRRTVRSWAGLSTDNTRHQGKREIERRARRMLPKTPPAQIKEK